MQLTGQMSRPGRSPGQRPTRPQGGRFTPTLAYWHCPSCIVEWGVREDCAIPPRGRIGPCPPLAIMRRPEQGRSVLIGSGLDIRRGAMARMQGKTTSDISQLFAGIDVSKAHLDLRLSCERRSRRFTNDPAGFAAIDAHLRARADTAMMSGSVVLIAMRPTPCRVFGAREISDAPLTAAQVRSRNSRGHRGCLFVAVPPTNPPPRQCH